jgi:glycosyltransferase involved in cell wall biosynthesis
MSWLAIDGGPAENLHRARGIGVAVRGVVTALDDDGVESGIVYLSCRPIASAAARWRPRSPTARFTGVDRSVPDRLSVMWQLVESAWALPRDVRRTGAEVFLATDPNAIALDHRFATVAMVYDFIPFVFPGQYLSGPRAALRRTTLRRTMARLRRAAGLIAISNATRDDAVRFLGVAASNVAVVPLAVDHAIFHPGAGVGRAPVAPTGGAPYVLYVGEADPRKNVGALMAAFRDAAVADLHLVIAGVSDRTRAGLRASLGDAARIHLVGAVDVQSLAALYAGATAFVFPSVYEGFGLPVLEAMACGAPVICSARAALPEVAGDAAVFADPERGSELRDAIRRVAGGVALRAELRQRGIARAAAFTWQATRDGVLEACRRVRPGGRSR